MYDKSHGFRKPRSLGALAVSLLLVLGLAGCKESSHKARSQPPPPPPASVTISGVAGLGGPLLDAVVDVYRVTNGVAGTTPIASTRTNATGAFTLSVTGAGPVVVAVTTDANTRMRDPLSGTSVPAPAGLRLRTSLASLANLQPIAVTPLTEMSTSLAGAANGGLTAANINAATTAVNAGFLGGASSLNTPPIDLANYPGAPVDRQQLAKLLTALFVAADLGIATGAGGAPCDVGVGDRDARLLCMIGGLGRLLDLGANNSATLQPAANYLAAAYTQIDAGYVTVAGGQAPAALGLDTPTHAETAFRDAVATQAGLPGYMPGDPLATTKALFADIRTNIIDPSAAQTIGLTPVATAVSDDFETNVRPVLLNGGDALRALKIASDLLASSHTDPAAGEPTSLTGPNGIVRGADGNLYVSAGFAHAILRVTPTGVITVFAGLAGVPGSDDGAAADARFSNPRGLVMDEAGNLFVADQTNHTIRKITPGGVVSTIAGQAGAPAVVNGVGTAARFSFPFGLARDAAGYLYVSELGNPAQVRKIAPDGTVTTFATGVATRTGGLATDAAGNVYATDLAAPRIRKITPAGVVSTLAGSGVPSDLDGLGVAAGFNAPLGIALDPATGLLFVADTGNHTVRLVTAGGLVVTIAGKALLPGNVDGVGAAARFRAPGALVVADGGLYVSDGGNNAIRRVPASGSTSTVAHGAAIYRRSGLVACGYDPPVLSAGQKNVALCRYGGPTEPLLLTLTETGEGNYTVATQPLTGEPTPQPTNPILLTNTRSPTLPALEATFSVDEGAGNALTATTTGPLYVSAAGGCVDAAIQLGAADGWDLHTSTGTLTIEGSFANGHGGIALASLDFGPNSSLSFTNLGALEGLPLPPGADLPGVQASLALNATTAAYAYDASFAIGAPVADASGSVGLPGSISLSGSVAAIDGGSRRNLFAGSITLSLHDIGSFDFTQPPGASNPLDLQVQIDGKLALTKGRELSVLATFRGKQDEPTPDAPFSATASYSYVTPSGTAQLNATAQLDSTNGFSATLTNNAGVTVNLNRPAGAKDVQGLAGTVTANGVSTATIAGAQINYSDGSTESLF